MPKPTTCSTPKKDATKKQTKTSSEQQSRTSENKRTKKSEKKNLRSKMIPTDHRKDKEKAEAADTGLKQSKEKTAETTEAEAKKRKMKRKPWRNQNKTEAGADTMEVGGELPEHRMLTDEVTGSIAVRPKATWMRES